jgi:argininosuccinate lyase
LWSGRFTAGITQDVLDYTHTTDVDERLVGYDIWGCLAHNIMLREQGIVQDEHARSIIGALLDLADDESRGTLKLDREHEDVHLNLESMVITRVGADAGGRMHTARSRNDQVMTATRLYLRDAIVEIAGELALFIQQLCERAEHEVAVIIPGYTHSQPAQPISLGFWLSAHASALLRDLRRLRDSYVVVDESPLGACALAGTSFPINRDSTRSYLGFATCLQHALDATSARDYLQQVVSALAILATNLTRLAEEIVVWSSHEYALLAVEDSFATGSSIMPQKKNPVVAELARARAGRVFGNLMQLLVITKGVALGYSCDLQEDKPMTWNSLDSIYSTIRLMRLQMAGIQVDAQRGVDLCYENFSTATDLTNYLVTAHELPFRTSHRVVGEIVSALTKQGFCLREADIVRRLLAERDIDASEAEIAHAVSPQRAVDRNTSVGGTSSDSVSATLQAILSANEALSQWFGSREAEVKAARQRTFKVARDFVGREPSVKDGVQA